ncbi:hypothetical protein [Marinibactrum halimedae]|uniref:Fibronectin type-III domain-containing protein n=1 Tax=Marinibactrum halimedae TaxID=1444977 RepID=A0AA37T6X9_9GAMM|nr:hypothetical protein [Marinibactrum halimedae]MCD9460194.1 hypothetical protein [Marinibactrum halimedae]GLS27974.1 hypothetical protein GCM10007877_36930 [Marinibactrum halimedae]
MSYIKNTLYFMSMLVVSIGALDARAQSSNTESIATRTYTKPGCSWNRIANTPLYNLFCDGKAIATRGNISPTWPCQVNLLPSAVGYTKSGSCNNYSISRIKPIQNFKITGLKYENRDGKSIDTNGQWDFSWTPLPVNWREKIEKKVAGGAWQEFRPMSGDRYENRVEHEFRIRACEGSSTSRCSEYTYWPRPVVSIRLPLDQNIEIFATPEGGSSIGAAALNVTWEEVEHANYYELQQASVDANNIQGDWVAVYAGENMSFSAEVGEDKAIPEYGRYVYQVKACNIISQSDLNDNCTDYHLSNESAILEALPDTPTLRSSVGQITKAHQFELRWNAVDENITYFLSQYFQGDGEESYSLITEYPASSGLALAVNTNGLDGRHGFSIKACFDQAAVYCSQESTIYRVDIVDESKDYPIADTPLYPQVPRIVSGPYTVTWKDVPYASHYLLQESVDYGQWREVVRADVLSFGRLPELDHTYGYRIAACNPDDLNHMDQENPLKYCSEFSPAVYTTYENDLSLNFRKRLYYSYADTDTLKDEAAFRFLELMYRWDNEERALWIDFDGENSTSFETLYGQRERNRADVVESDVKEVMLDEENANSESLKILLLDILYDRAVGDIMEANLLIDQARIVRLREPNQYDTGDILRDERAHYHNAYEILNKSFGKLKSFTEAHSELFKEFTPTRALNSPVYRRAEDDLALPVLDEDDDGQIDRVIGRFTGYKEVVLAYELMTKLANTKASVTKLDILEGQIDSTNSYIAELETLISDLEKFETEFDALFQSPAIDEISDDISAVSAAVNSFTRSIENLRSTLSWLEGKTDLIGFGDDAIAIFHDPNAPEKFSFDILRERISGSGYLNRAIQSELRATESYDNYRYTNDRVADTFFARHQILNNRFQEITGLELCEGELCEEICSDKDPEQCTFADLFTAESLIQQQKDVIDQTTLSVESQNTRFDNLLASIEIKTKELESLSDLDNKMANVMMSYGNKQIALSKDIERIQNRKNKVASLISAATSVVSGGFSASILKNFTGSDKTAKKKSAIGLTNSIGSLAGSLTSLFSGNKQQKLREEKERLALEERVELHRLNGEKTRVAGAAHIKQMWLEANLILIDIKAAEVRQQVEINRLAKLLLEAADLLQKNYKLKTEVASRFFADPIHYSRLTEYMEEAEFFFERAQFEMVLAVNAIEHHWMEEFDQDYFDRSSIYRARSAKELSNIWTAMQSFHDYKGTLILQPSESIFSIKHDHFGLGFGLDENKAFQATLKALKREDSRFITLTGINTAKSKGGNATRFYRGPEISEHPSIDDEYCVQYAGTYLDKIVSVSVEIDGEMEGNYTEGFLTYGDHSFFRTPYVANEVVESESEEGESNYVLPDDVRTFSSDTWFYDGGNNWVKRRPATALISANKTEQIAFPTQTFKERSVAATGWRLSLRVEDDNNDTIVDLDAIRDINIIFNHRYANRVLPGNPVGCPLLLRAP